MKANTMPVLPLVTSMRIVFFHYSNMSRINEKYVSSIIWTTYIAISHTELNMSIKQKLKKNKELIVEVENPVT